MRHGAMRGGLAVWHHRPGLRFAPSGLRWAKSCRRTAMSAVAAVAQSPSPDIANLDALYEEAARVGLTPGWVPRKKPILWAEPKSEFVPAHWRWADARPALDAAGRLIDVALAERRN